VVQNTLLAGCMGIAQHHEVIPPSDVSAEQVLDHLLAFDWRSQSYVVLHPFPMWRYKRWTEAGWQNLGKYLIAAGKKVVITGGGGEDERACCTLLAVQLGPQATSLAGRTSFGVMSTLLAHASAYIGPDTATTHLAAACGIPTLALYGPSNPIKWGPWPKDCIAAPSPWEMSAPYQKHGNVLLLQGVGSCVPCREEGCDRHRNSESRCMTEMSSARVISAYESLARG
jgi:heptosyltransferase III